MKAFSFAFSSIKHLFVEAGLMYYFAADAGFFKLSSHLEIDCRSASFPVQLFECFLPFMSTSFFKNLAIESAFCFSPIPDKSGALEAAVFLSIASVETE